MAPLLAGTVRMIVAAFIGWLSVAWFGRRLSTLFQIVAGSALLFGGITAMTTFGRVRSPTLVSAPRVQPDAAE